LAKSGWTVETVPFYAKPFFWIYGYGLGFIAILLFVTLRLTCRIVVVGAEQERALPNYIGCLWHDRVMTYFSAFIFIRQRKQAWLNHAAAYMKPIHVVIKFIGVEKIILGSSGHQGKMAADELAGYLKQGYSTMINPDGPYGPKFEWKKGALHLSRQTGVPILPIKVEARPYWKWPSWDRKWVPYPFISTIRITYGAPVYVKSENFEEELRLLNGKLG